MRILFALNTLGFLRHFDRVVADLADRGHRITLGVTDQDGARDALPDGLRDRTALRIVEAPFERDGSLRGPVRLLRGARDYLRYHEAPFEGKDAFRARAFDRLQHAAFGRARTASRRQGPTFAGLTPAESARARRMLQALEELVPTDPACDRFVQSERPDVVLVTPLVWFSSPLVDIVKSARSRSIPVGFPVFSWDNLSTKGVVHVAPDRVFVWNEVQRREAVELHGLDPSRVAVTGAPRFDEFFETRPTESREALCQRLGFDRSRPIITYLGSSPFVSPTEPAFVDEWIGALRQTASEPLRTANILVRPHPRSDTVWQAWTGRRRAGVGMHATGFLGDQALYDCLYHADAVVALNTSAQIEAGILGKPVLTVLAPTHAPGQQGSVHFDYLLDTHGGHVQVAATLGQHVEQLDAVLRGSFDPEPCRRFIEQFIRPAGFDRPASPMLADAIEQWMTAQPRPRSGRWSRMRKQVARALAGDDLHDEAAVAAVVRARVRSEHRAMEERIRRERRRVEEWKTRAGQLTAELEHLRAGRSDADARSPGRRDADQPREAVADRHDQATDA